MTTQTTQPETLRLAELAEYRDYPSDRLIAAELHRLHEEVTELRHAAGVANMTIQRQAQRIEELEQEASGQYMTGYEVARSEFQQRIQELEAQGAQPEQRPISDVTEAVTRTVIQVEKLLCGKLGKQWQAGGMSISTLVDELALRTTPPQRKPWVSLTAEDVTYSLPYSVTRDKGCFHAGVKWADAKLKEKNNG